MPPNSRPQYAPQPSQQGRRPMDMREVNRSVQPGPGQRARSPQTSPNKPRSPVPQPRSISPIQPAYHPDPRYRQQQSQPYQQYPPSRPNLQVNVTAPKDPFIDPPRAAFAAPPSPTLSDTAPGSPIGGSTRNLLHSPSSQSITGSAASNPDNDRLAPAAGGQDFWKRFSMVAHEAELEKSAHPNGSGKDPWLSKEFRGTRKFKYGVWTIGLICIAAIAGGLAWHFTHNDGPKLSAPTQHDFGLGGTSSVARTGIAGGLGGGAPETSAIGGGTRPAAVAVATAVPTTSLAEETEEVAADIAEETSELETPEEDADEEVTTTTRRSGGTTVNRISTALVARATSTSHSRSTLARRHRQKPARQ